MDNKPSYIWALALGVLFPVLLVLVFTFLYDGQGMPASLIDYVYLYLAGAIIGFGLVYLLRKCTTRGSYRTVIIFFLVSLPFALFGMVTGGMVGAVGLFFLGVSPALFLTGLGYFIGRLVFKK